MFMITQDKISTSTPMGANLVTTPVAGATFRVWAPGAAAVYLNGTFNGSDQWTQDTDPNQALARIGGSDWWGGFLAGAAEGDTYKFFVVGTGTRGYKRDPYGRERQANGNSVIKDPAAYKWHDAGFRAPAFNDLIIYQLHVGTFYRRNGTGDGTFWDVLEKLPYLQALGVNAVQLLPVIEFETDNSMGYNGSDYFAPEWRYGTTDPASLTAYLATVNGLLTAKGFAPVTAEAISGPVNALKALIDLCHVYGLAVMFDVVFNHAGGFDGDDESIFFWDRQPPGDNNRSLYFIATDNMPSGGLPFALWKEPVRQFLIDKAAYWAGDYHADGFRYDEISLLMAKNAEHGWGFCQAVTGTVRYEHPQMFHNAEFWPVNAAIVTPAAAGGAGFDGMQNDGLRLAVRGALGQTTAGAGARVELSGVAQQLWVPGLPARWKAVQCLENHDVVYRGRDPRIPTLADANDPWSWYGRSRSRVALGWLMTAPGIPHIFMGQEFLETKPWSDDPNGPLHIYWDGLARGLKPMTDFLRFTQDLIWFRRNQPALRSESINVFHCPAGNRVLAFHRWVEGEGRDLVIVASLAESTYYNYRLGFPGGGRWAELFNSDMYDNWVNPATAGNGGQVWADANPADGLGYGATLTIPANGLLIFGR